MSENIYLITYIGQRMFSFIATNLRKNPPIHFKESRVFAYSKNNKSLLPARTILEIDII